jgi:hypothetical protein
MERREGVKKPTCKKRTQSQTAGEGEILRDCRLKRSSMTEMTLLECVCVCIREWREREGEGESD